MYNLDIQNKIEMLPENAKQELFDFTEFLLSKYLKSPKGAYLAYFLQNRSER